MTNTATNKTDWTQQCAERISTVAGLPLPLAKDVAEACADGQEQECGSNVAEWEAPAEAADEEMSYWDNDE